MKHQKLIAKYLISDTLLNCLQHTWFTNEELYRLVQSRTSASFKTVQNVTAGLKSFGGLRSKRDNNRLRYTRVSRKALITAEAYQF